MLNEKKGVYFDFDGVLVDSTESIMAKAYIQAIGTYHKRPNNLFLLDVLKARSKAVKAEYFWKTLVGSLNKAHGLPSWELEEVLEISHRYAKPELEKLKLRDGAIDLFHALQDNGQDIGLVTTSARETIDVVASQNPAFAKAFGDNIITSNDGGPKAKSYTKMIERFNHKPYDVTAIEDSPGGIQSARDAGIDDIIAYINPGLFKGKVKSATMFRITSFEQLRG